ncbi:hypothetical protein [Candidatus Symbiopectobacterium sp.]|uniref:hypothetical protein n=1 Tax=Candidatus Symbiopectobacterium sp. TaxID=2816440 RepID=UPI0025C029F0|nr:hypothetical protein [Candidatus Symbiopectobacterium sp.]
MWQGPENRGLLVKDGRHSDTDKLNPFIFNELIFNLIHGMVGLVLTRWLFKRRSVRAHFFQPALELAFFTHKEKHRNRGFRCSMWTTV